MNATKRLLRPSLNNVTKKLDNESTQNPKQLKPKLITKPVNAKPAHLNKKALGSPVKTRFNLRQNLLHPFNQHQMIQKNEIHTTKMAYKEYLKSSGAKAAEFMDKKPKKLKTSATDEVVLTNKTNSEQIGDVKNISTSSQSHNHHSHQVASQFKANSSFQSSSMESENPLQTFQIGSNPIHWTAKDVCRYLLENKFDPHLIYLIEEHVRHFFHQASLFSLGGFDYRDYNY